MKRKVYAIFAMMIALQLLLSGIVMVNADEIAGIGEEYTAPESPSVTYNMNLDWRFMESPVGMTGSVKQAWEAVAKDGKQFYEVGYDDTDWASVSIPHGINGEDAFMSNTVDSGGGKGRLGVFLYRKEFTVPASAAGGKVVFEMEGIRQAAYVWVNGQRVGYYEAGITAMGFDITKFVTPGETALIAIVNDCSATSGNTQRFAYETVPGDEWGSSYTPDNYKTAVSGASGIVGAGYQWNTRQFNETQAGLVYDAYLHITGNVYQTFPLYNNLKTTGNYIYATDFDIRAGKAKINVDAEIRNESGTAGDYTLEVAVVDNDGKLAYNFKSAAASVAAATDAGVVYETAVESDVYSEANIANPVGITSVNTPDVTHIKASYDASDVRFWTDTDPYLYTVYTILRDSSGNAVDVQKKETGFRKVTYDKDNGVMINDRSVWLKGYAQRSTNEWAVIGVATDWLTDYDMELLKSNNANFIRWMHVAPKPAAVRSSDRYGVVVVCPAGDKEADVSGRQWSQRAEAMRDAMIYFRNSPSVLFWETGNTAIAGNKANEMADLRDTLDPYGMRFIGARSTRSADQLNYDYNYAGTMYGNYAAAAKSEMEKNGIMGPIMETEYAREESPRRVWDNYSPPDYDYVNKALHGSKSKLDGYDAHDLTQEEITVRNIGEYNGYYSNRAGHGNSLYSAEAMMVWTDSNMHGRNTASENCRTSGRVDAVRQTKEMYEGTRVAHSDESAVHIIGHWSYPQVSEDTYNYFGVDEVTIETNDKGERTVWYDKINIDKKLKRDPTTKTVYVIGSVDVAKVELYRVDGKGENAVETLLGTDDKADSTFIYQFDNIDVTKGDGVIAKAYNARGEEVALDNIVRTGNAAALRLIPHMSVKDVDGETVNNWKADGADIAYFDVEVVDENGNVCALNYDRINFTYTGEGEYLGGYNSGMGYGCFQNSQESAGLSFYFDGMKDNISTIRKDYVYAENGTNRIFVKSTRNAGTFTLTANMAGGIAPVSASITSVPVEMDDETGLTFEMPSHLKPGLSSDRPDSNAVVPMKPLTDKFTAVWANVKIEKEVDNNVYYKVMVNGTELALGDTVRARKGNPSGVIAPVKPILDALGVDYTLEGSPLTLTMNVNGHAYTTSDGSNTLYEDGVQPGNETVQAAEVIGGELFVNLGGVFQYISGIDVSQDDDNLTVNITKAQ